MLKLKLSPDIDTDENYYFFSMLSDRFIPLNQRWAKGLEKRFGKVFKPIYVLPFYHNEVFEEENFIVLNEWTEEVQALTKRTDIMNLIYPEDVNKQFSRSPEVKRLIERLKKKQGKVFVLGFTSVWLDLNDPDVIVLGPNSALAAHYDAKIEHYRTFEALGMDTVQATVYKDIEELRDNKPQYPIFLSAMYSSGGIESKAIRTDNDLDAYYSHLRLVNKSEPLIATKYVDDIDFAPNSTAIVMGEESVVVINVSDQILRNNQYMGNIYPSKVTPTHEERIKAMTLAVGQHLAKEGFRGLFGLDFLMTKTGQCYPVDLNPRRQGGYYCNALASKVDLIELELAAIFNEPAMAVSYEDFQVDYAWAHSKLTPHHQDMRIIAELHEGDPLEPFRNIGTTFKAIYYPKGYTLMVGNPGFYLTTGASYDEVRGRLDRETEDIIAKSYE